MKLNRKTVILLALVTIVLFVPSSTGLFSQNVSQQCVNQAKQSIVTVAKAMQSKGFSLNGTTPRLGALSEGQSATFQTLLMKGNTYAFVVAGGCVATIVLHVYDENKNLVGKYDGGKPFAAVLVQPKWTGKFFGVVKLQGSTQDPAVVVQLLGWKQNI